MKPRRVVNHKRSMKVPTETFDNAVIADSKRVYPSVECLTKVEQAELERRVAGLIDFETNARVPYQVADYISKRLTGKPEFEERDVLKFEGGPKKKKYFFRDPWDGDSLMIVKEGQQPITKGFNLVLCHSDSPCLKIKPKPIRLEWDPEKVYQYLGVRLSAIEHGGLSIHQWPAQQVRVMGYVLDKKGKKTFVDVPGFVPDFSGHVDYPADEKIRERFEKEKTLEVVLGHTSVKETLDRFGLTSMDDFGNAKLFAVPNNVPMPIDEYTWRLLASYGHDDRACVYSAVDAIVKAREPTLTSIVWITDNEEVGDPAPSGANGNFFNLFFDYLCYKHNAKTREKISEAEKRRICMRSSFLYSDINVAPSGYDAELMDVANAPKLGFGIAISGEEGDLSTRGFVRKLRDIALRGQKIGYNICHQVVGEIYNQDMMDRWCIDPFAQEFVKTIGQWGYVGIPCASSHSPNEILCPGDEYAHFKFLRRFFESNTGLGFDK